MPPDHDNPTPADGVEPSPMPAQGESPPPADADHYELDPTPPARPVPPPPTPAQVEAARRAELRELEPEAIDDSTEDEEQEPASSEPLVSPALKDHALFAWIGAGLLLAAGVLAGLGAEKNQLARAIATMYNGGLFAALGVVAAWAYTRIDPRPLGPWPALAARMLLAVAIFQLVSNVLQGGLRQFVLTLVAVPAYGAALALSLHWRPRRVARVALVHYILGLALYLALTMHAWATGG